jgi:hypothetical protein
MKLAACALTVMLPSRAWAVMPWAVQAMVPDNPWRDAVRVGVRVIRLDPVP